MFRLLADITPLRHSRPFRRLWFAQLLSGIGSQLTAYAVALQVWRLSGSSVAVGGIGLVSGAAGITVGLLAGGIVDAIDRRRLVITVALAQVAVSAALASHALMGSRQLWPLYTLVGAQSALASLGVPARQSFLAHLLQPGQLTAGASLQTLAGRAGRVLGPALGGLLAATSGLSSCYLLDALTFLTVCFAASLLPHSAPAVGGRLELGLRAIGRGLEFIAHSRLLTGVLLADLSATLLALPVALFPAINDQRFQGDPRTLGLMGTAMAIGGIAGSALSGPVSHVERQGRAMLTAVAAWGAAIVCFGLADSLTATLLALAIADSADVTSVSLRASIIQSITPEPFRGRVAATEHVVGAAVPQLGNFRAGVVASVTGPTFSAISGGAAAVAAAAILAVTLPSLTSYDQSKNQATARG